MKNPLLRIENLQTSFRIQDRYHAAVDDVSLTVHENEIVAIVGESGCGKSALALSIMRLHNEANTKLQGQLNYRDKDLLTMSAAEINKVRGSNIGMIFQEPLTALDSYDGWKTNRRKLRLPHKSFEIRKKERTLELLHQVGIPKPELTYKQYPHELSGGMRQRIVIAIAIACKPGLIIADEPTTALDVTIQAQILDLLKSIQEQTKWASS